MSAPSDPPADDARAWLARQGFDLGALAPRERQDAKAGASFVPPLQDYDHVLVAFSGGKDSLACLLRLLELGVSRSRIECQHHLVDGREGSTMMDWPVTESYCEAVCKALDVALTFSWREGGIEREACRSDSATAPVWIPVDGGWKTVGGQGPLGTRRKFPQLSADLSLRWCSASAKISCLDAYLRHHPRFLGRRTLVVTGERREESPARARYPAFAPHRSDTRASRTVPRHIDHWRAVHDWREQQVWHVLRRWRVCPHPCYFLGFSRCSCRCCIFGNADQWATVRAIAPRQFQQVAALEREFGVTIHRHRNVLQLADAGTPYPHDAQWEAIANSRTFAHPVFVDPWELPPGAFGKGGGPS